MSKKKSKSDLKKLISDTDALEIAVEEINRNESSSKKQSALLSFLKDVNEHVKDQRDVILVSIKVK